MKCVKCKRSEAMEDDQLCSICAVMYQAGKQEIDQGYSWRFDELLRWRVDAYDKLWSDFYGEVNDDSGLDNKPTAESP